MQAEPGVDYDDANLNPLTLYAICAMKVGEHQKQETRNVVLLTNKFCSATR